jgi:eukaryotic-like serine/threonine-protein kinase
MAMTADTPPRRSFPERIGRYQILERIGRGAMGVVYRAHDAAMGRDVALKVLMTDLEDDPDIRTRFHREAEAAARLSHPNIITIFDVGEDAERFFIVMELLRGAMLKDFLKHADAVPIERKIDLMYQLCVGLDAAHNASVYHRDIKPGNIFVRSDGILKILDFGVARLATSSMTASGFIVGTPDYMSPEQARGAEIDGRSDIFSLGGVFYFILTGRKPFPASELPSLFHQIQHDTPAPLRPEEAPAELADVVMKALLKDRGERYQTCQDMIVDLEVIRQAHPLKVRRLPVASPATVAPAVDVSSAVLNTSPTAPAKASIPPTDETVDFLPAFNGDDTVSMTPPLTWMRRVTGRIDSAVSGRFARLWRPAPTVPPRQSGIRKR